MAALVHIARRLALATLVCLAHIARRLAVAALACIVHIARRLAVATLVCLVHIARRFIVAALVRIARRLVMATMVCLMHIARQLFIVSAADEVHFINFEVMLYSWCLFVLVETILERSLSVVVGLVEADPIILYLFWQRLYSDRG